MKTRPNVKNSVVQILSNVVNASPNEPWSTNSLRGTSTGFILEYAGEKIIITNAHCVSSVNYISFQFPDNPQPYEATISHINHACDLAVLTCSNPAFLEKAVPLQLAESLPPQNSKVAVHGFPRGNHYSVTNGTISRIDTTPYSHSAYPFINLTLDVTSQRGNSGGPLLDEDSKVIGVTHQGEQGAQGTAGFAGAIPLPILKHFLAHPEGFPEMQLKGQFMNNPVLREAYGLSENQGGVLVRDVNIKSCAFGILQPDDTILEIDGYPLNMEGSVRHADVEAPIFYTHLIHMHALGDEVKIKIMRDKKEEMISIILNKPIWKTLAVKNAFDEEQFRYICMHGLAFVPLTKNYVNGMAGSHSMLPPGRKNALNSLSQKSEDVSKFFAIAKVIPSTLTQGLQSYEHSVVDTIDGIKVRSACHLLEILKTPPENGLHKIATHENAIIMLKHLSEKENQQLLSQARIPSTTSPKLFFQCHKNNKRKNDGANTLEESNTKKARFG